MFFNDRRQRERVRVSLDACWEGLTAQCGGLVVDLSEAGCFILTSDRVVSGETVRLELRPQWGGRVYAWGEVIYQVSEMGFALRFVNSGEDSTPLTRLMERLRDGRYAGAVA
jgi:hypothetical protein